MKKLLFGLIILTVLLGFASCDADSIMKFGNSIGNMGNNVYGIKPDMSQVKETLDVISQSISFTEDGKAKIDFENINEVSFLISHFNSSTQKRKAVLELVKNPVEETAAKSFEVQRALKDKLTTSRSQISTTLSTLPEEETELNSLLSTLLNCVDQIRATVSSIPTFSDLITVTTVVDLCDIVSDEFVKFISSEIDEETKAIFGGILNEAAMQCLDVIDTINEDYDYISRLDAAEIFSAFAVKKEKKDLADTFSNPQVDVFLQSLFDLIGRDSDGHLNRNNFDRFVSTSVTRRAIYEIAAYGLSMYEVDNKLITEDGSVAEGASFLNFTKFAKYSSNDVFTGNDVLSYLISLIFTDINKLSGCFDNNYDKGNPYVAGYFSLYDFLDAAANKDSEKINNVLSGYKSKPALIVKSLFVGDQESNTETITSGYMAISTTVNTAYTIILDCGFNVWIENLLRPVVQKVEDYIDMAFFIIELMNSDFSDMDLDDIDEKIIEDPVIE